ncbi:phosphonate ABC transporter substrate-binding protein [Deinococcus oregonensis]|uniref:Phosphonate ABC transporter substrate-binding protein n=1 Tax=Deinococcus oregonensis TaxID=1805970 RepID=A0ABV6AVR6_9DEIO
MRQILLTTLALTVVSGAAAQSRAGWPTVLNIGIIPTEGSSASDERYAPLFTYLKNTLGVEVKSYVGADYAAVILAMQGKKIDMAYFGPKSYIEAADRAGAQALVRENALKGGTGYHSVIVVRADSPVKTMAQLKGMDFAFVDPNSTSGYLVPMSHFLLDLKVKPETYFKRVIFAGTHENVILGVKNGTIPVGATNDLDLARAVEGGALKASDLRIIWTSKEIPASTLSVRRDLPETFKKALSDALVKFKDPKGLENLQLKGYVVTTDQDYDPIRKLNEVTKAAAK